MGKRPRTRSTRSARSPTGWAARSSTSIATRASAAPRVEMGVPLSTPCARARPGASSTSSWPGRLIDLAGPCKTWSRSLTELHALKIGLYLHQQGVDTTTPGGKALFQMMGVFAEFERSIIQDRIHAGLARARAQGKRL